MANRGTCAGGSLEAHGLSAILPPIAPGAGADGFWSRHPGGCQFLVCDGSVHFVKPTLAPEVFRALASRAGGEVVGADQY